MVRRRDSNLHKTSESLRRGNCRWRCYSPRRQSGSTITRSAREQRNRQRAALLQEYMEYIQRVALGQAGRLEPGEGETTQAIRRRLAAAAEALGKELQVRRSANAVYFWASEGPRRGRPRRDPAA